MDSSVCLPAMNYILFENNVKVEANTQNGPPKTSKKKLSKKANCSKPIIYSSDDDSEDEMPSRIDINGIDSTFGNHDEPSNDTDDWSTDDDTELVDKVKSTCRTNDKTSYKTRLRQLDWNTIAFKKYSGPDCEKRLKEHLKNVRRHRNLSEIVNDVELNIKKCPIKKPLNAYQLFIQDQLTKQTTSGLFTETMRNISTRYAQLSAEERAIYERKALQLSSEYKELKDAYKSGNFKAVNEKKETPTTTKLKTPFMLYLEDAKLKNENVNANELRENYANLSIDEKYKYVLKAVSLAPNVNQTTLLNKMEQRIFKGQVKTAPTAYSLFVKETFPKIKAKGGAKNAFSEISKKWKKLNENERKVYIEAAKIMKAKAKKEQAAFNERHGVTPMKIKRRRSTCIEQETETEEALFTPPSLPIKKRKTSVSTQGSDLGVEDTKRKTQTTKNEPESPTERNKPEQSSPFPTSIIYVPLSSSTEQKRKKSNSETSDSTLHQLDGDAVDSTTTSSSSKKKWKKEKKYKKEEQSKGMPPPDPELKPPADLFTYFAKHVHTGKLRKARKAFDRLTKAEKKQLNAEYNTKVDKYVTYLKAYLATLPKDEAKAYIEMVKATEDAEKAVEERKELSNEQSVNF